MNSAVTEIPDSSSVLPWAAGFLGRVRRSWQRSYLLRALLVAPALSAGLAGLLVAIDFLYPLGADARLILRPLPLFIAALYLLVQIVRTVRAPSPSRLALLAEEESPDLQGYLITSLEPVEGTVGEAFRRAAERRLGELEATFRVRSRSAPAAGSLALSLTLLAGALLAAGPNSVWDRWASPAPGESLAAVAGGGLPFHSVSPPPVDAAAALTELRWTVTPPSYSGLGARSESDPALVNALPGSLIRVESRHDPVSTTVVARVVGGSERTLAAPTKAAGGWALEWVLGTDERGLALELEREDEVIARRVIPIRALTDYAPEVQLEAPREDMVIGSGEGVVHLRATAQDDFGVERFFASWIHSSGSGESFSFEEGELEWASVRRVGAVLAGELDLDLSTLGLGPGDALHIRAVARDGNTVTGPGEGVSRTRVIRVAREDEMAEINSLVGFPLEAEQEPILSQRMIILLTERLREQAPTLSRADFQRESARIADEQARLRARVGEEVLVRLTADEDHTVETGLTIPAPGMAGGDHAHDHHDHDHSHDHGGERRSLEGLDEEARMEAVLEAASRATGTGRPEEEMHFHDSSPLMGMNPVKLAAYNEMWDSERNLRQSEPVPALPHQHRALEHLQELREEVRVFPRGRQRAPPIDVSGTRGTGSLDGATPAARSRGNPAPSAADRVADLEEVLVRLGSGSPAEVSMELANLALRLLADPAADPQAAALLSQAADAAAAGQHDQAILLAHSARAVLAPRGAAGSAPSLPSSLSPEAAAYFGRLGSGGAR